MRDVDRASEGALTRPLKQLRVLLGEANNLLSADACHVRVGVRSQQEHAEAVVVRLWLLEQSTCGCRWENLKLGEGRHLYTLQGFYVIYHLQLKQIRIETSILGLQNRFGISLTCWRGSLRQPRVSEAKIPHFQIFRFPPFSQLESD